MLGIGVAMAAVRVLVVLAPAALPRAEAIGVDAAAFAFGLCVTTIVGVCVGLIPALQAARNDPGADLQGASRRWAG